MNKSRLLGAVCAGMLSFVTLSVNAALIGRLPATMGGTDWQAYFDDQLNITWTADANINASKNWDTQRIWAANLMINGVGGWRLPILDRNGDGIIAMCSSDTQSECLDNEYGHLFFYGAGATLGNGVTAASSSPFSNVQSTLDYWSGLNPNEAIGSNTRFVFGFDDGALTSFGKLGSQYAWAVMDGDVGAVPVPAAVWLFGSGLIGLLGLARRKR